MKITYVTMLAAAACMASGLMVTGCAGPSTRVLPRESSSAYEAVIDEIPVLEEVNPYYLQEELDILTASQRFSGSRGESDAARYMEQLLTDYGYEVDRQRFRYGDPKGTFVTGTNLEAVRRAPSEDADILIVSTHHDTAAGSRGAWDNASGTVIWLETARLVSKLPTDTEVRFVSVSGSEDGWLGARHYVDSLTKKERERVIGCIEIDAMGYVSESRIVLGTPDGKATMLGDMVKESVWDVLEETWQYEIRQQKGYLAFTRAQIPSLCLTQVRDAYEAGTPMDVVEIVDIERIAQIVNVMTQTVSEIMSLDSPSMLAKSRFMNDLRDDAHVRVQDEEIGFGDTREQTELRLGIAGDKQAENTDASGRNMERYEYRMKWFDVDQMLLTSYYFTDGRLDMVGIDGDGAGVEFDDMKERLTSWYGEPESESEGPSGIQYVWRSALHRTRAELIPGSDGYDVELYAYEPEWTLLETFLWGEDAGENKAAAADRRMKLLLERISLLCPKQSAVPIDRINIYTDGIGGTDGYVEKAESGQQETEVGREIYLDLEDALTEDGNWRDETATNKLILRLYGELLERENPDGIADLFAQQFPELPDDGTSRVETGIEPGVMMEPAQGVPDFADSFAMFVLAGQPEETEGDWNQRILFFYGFENMVAYRSQVQENLDYLQKERQTE